MTETTTFIIPHPKLMSIKGTPINRSIKLLKKQLFAKVQAVHSTRRGGRHAHMALLLTATSYYKIAGNAFTLSTHPGEAPIHCASATNAQIARTNCQYNATLNKLKVHQAIHTTLKQQILATTTHLFLNTLEAHVMGYADMDAVDMLKYLDSKYATITSDDIKRNWVTLSKQWNPDTEIEDLWLRLNKAQVFSLDVDNNNNHVILDNAAIHLTIAMFKKEQLFITYCDMWCDCNKDTQTMDAFKNHFKMANKGQLCKLTAEHVGYHGATNAAQAAPPPEDILPNGCVQVNGG